MGAQEKIARLRELVRNAYNAIANKGGSVPEVGERTVSNLSAAIESVPSPVKVKVASLKVTSGCINDEGRWEGDKSIDTSNVASLSEAFRSVTNMVEIDASNWDTSKVTSCHYTFQGCSSLRKALVKKIITKSVTNATFMFNRCGALENIDTTEWDTTNVTNTNSMFYLDDRLEVIDATSWEVPNLTNADGMFSCINLKSLVGGRTIDEVINKDLCVLKGYKIGHDLYLSNTQIDRASLRALINGLSDLTDSTSKTLKLGTKLQAKLTEEDIAIATSKNWSIA